MAKAKANLIGNLPEDSKWSMGKTREALDPDKEKMLEALTDKSTFGADKNKAIKDAIKSSNENQVAQSAEDTGIMSKEKALENIAKGNKAAHGEENNPPESNPLVNKELGVENNEGAVVSPGEITSAASKDPETRYKMRSIFDAYANGEIDNKTRDYLVVDALGKFASNMGKDLANVAAAYTGGTMNNERDKSLWQQRNEEMMKSGIESEKAGVEGSREWREAQNDALNREAQKVSNMNAKDQRAYALKLMSRFYDKNGKFIGDVNSADFKNSVTLMNQLMSGGGAKDSLLSQLASRFLQFSGM